MYYHGINGGNMGTSETDIVAEVKKLQLKAEELCKLCDLYRKINGMPKLARKCRAEQKFLNGLLQTPDLVSCSHLKSSNLAHLQGILLVVEAFSDISQVLSPFRLPSVEHPVHVDVICNQGSTWIKVIARNSKALQIDTAGQQAFGDKTVFDQAKQFIELSQLHPHNYSPPNIMFVFFHEVPPMLLSGLTEIGIDACEFKKIFDKQKSCLSYSVDVFERSCSSISYKADRNFSDSLGNSNSTKVKDVLLNKNKSDNKENTTSLATGDSSESSYVSSNGVFDLPSFCCESCSCAMHFKQGVDVCSNIPESNSTMMSLNKINLDITTLFALVSNLCHGGCAFVFQEGILTEQAAEERRRPLLPLLIKFLHHKQLFVCQTAFSDFQKILSTVGGPKEKERASRLLQGVTIISDDPSQRSLKLPTTAKLSNRAKTIFGTGDSLRAVTTTANQGFVRAAAQVSTEFVVYVHEARALTEQKENSAVVFEE